VNDLIRYDEAKDAYVNDAAELLRWEHELAREDYTDWFIGQVTGR
jgi:hypothetical protein